MQLCCLGCNLDTLCITPCATAHKKLLPALKWRGQDSTVGVTSQYGLDCWGLNPGGVKGFFFSMPVQIGSENHPASCTMGTGSLPWVYSGWCVPLTIHTHAHTHTHLVMCTAILALPDKPATAYYRLPLNFAKMAFNFVSVERCILDWH